MKKYIVFAISFIVLFTLFQVLSGLLLTLTYNPDIQSAWNSSANLPQETMITSNNHSFLLTLFLAFLSATIAYVIPEKLFTK